MIALTYRSSIVRFRAGFDGSSDDRRVGSFHAQAKRHAARAGFRNVRAVTSSRPGRQSEGNTPWCGKFGLSVEDLSAARFYRRHSRSPHPLQGALTTSQAVYQLGQPVQLTYTETNTSDQTVTVTILNPILFQLLHNGQPVSPVMDPLGSNFETIGPGQTVQHHFTLSQADFGGSDTLQNLTGSFAVEVHDVPEAPGEFTADFQIADVPSGAIVSSVSTNQPVYQAGETVTMTFTETNTSDQAVMVLTGQNGFAFAQVLPAAYSGIPSLPGPTTTGWSTLQPGQSWTQSETWPVVDPVSGPYTVKISNFFDLNGNTSTFVVVGRVHVRQFVCDHKPSGLQTWRERPRQSDDPRQERVHGRPVSRTDHGPGRHAGRLPADPPDPHLQVEAARDGPFRHVDDRVERPAEPARQPRARSPGPTRSTSPTAISAAPRPSLSAASDRRRSASQSDRLLRFSTCRNLGGVFTRDIVADRSRLTAQPGDLSRNAVSIDSRSAPNSSAGKPRRRFLGGSSRPLKRLSNWIVSVLSITSLLLASIRLLASGAITIKHHQTNVILARITASPNRAKHAEPTALGMTLLRVNCIKTLLQSTARVSIRSLPHRWHEDAMPSARIRRVQRR